MQKSKTRRKTEGSTDMQNNLPFNLCNERWGEPISVEEECPGVFFVTTSTLCELYVVTDSAIPDVIPQEALYYGVAENGATIYTCGDNTSGWAVIEYEILRYKAKMGGELRQEGLYEAAMYAAEHCPEYFGGLIPPRITPWGLTMRVKYVENGIYFLEAASNAWVLAVAYPIWQTEFSDAVQTLGKFCEQDRMLIDDAALYLYFREDQCAPAILELIAWNQHDALLAYISSREILETYVYAQSPLYAMYYNLMQMSGLGTTDAFRTLLLSLGCDEAYEGDTSVEEHRAQHCMSPLPVLTMFWRSFRMSTGLSRTARQENVPRSLYRRIGGICLSSASLGKSEMYISSSHSRILRKLTAAHCRNRHAITRTGGIPVTTAT